MVDRGILFLSLQIVKSLINKLFIYSRSDEVLLNKTQVESAYWIKMIYDNFVHFYPSKSDKNILKEILVLKIS